MGAAKNIEVHPITRQSADAIVKRFHYSGKVVLNSQLHLGVFLSGNLLGAMQFGPSLDKRKLIGLVAGTRWNDFIELNRMAFSTELPRNSESRALSIAFKMLRRGAPHIGWVVTFADATQCGDGTIYRAAGFLLTSIKKNTQIWEAPTGDQFSRHGLTAESYDKQREARSLINEGKKEVFSRMSLTDNSSAGQQRAAREIIGNTGVARSGALSMKECAASGFRPLPGFQLRYLYFIDPAKRKDLTVPVIPFSEIEARGASMYLGKARAGKKLDVGTTDQEGGAVPTPALQETR